MVLTAKINTCLSKTAGSLNVVSSHGHINHFACSAVRNTFAFCERARLDPHTANKRREEVQAYSGDSRLNHDFAGCILLLSF